MARTYDDSRFIDAFEHEYTWLNGFRRNARRFSQRTALIDPEQNLTWTYGELEAESNRFANALLDFGLAKDDLVMAALRNSPAFVLSYLAPRKIGCI
ncbi:MAG: AMP-binding protein, partial [Treponema sp.]|nr:AMP-binding protein [Treponema sp.]